MLSIGVLDSGGCNVNVMPTPEDFGKLKKDVVFYVENDSGVECGYSNQSYWQNGGNLLTERQAVISKSDVILLDDTLNESVNPVKKKIFITNFNVMKEYEKLMMFLSQNVDLYSFHHSTFQNKAADTSMRELFIDFIKFYLGDPVHPDSIYAFSNAKVISNGKIIHTKLISNLNQS